MDFLYFCLFVFFSNSLGYLFFFIVMKSYVSIFAVTIAEYFSTFGQIEAVKVTICKC